MSSKLTTPSGSDTCFLFNPSSNSDRATIAEQELKALIHMHFPKAAFISTKADLEFWDRLENRLKDIHTVIACGGDGTVHKVGNLAVKLNAALGVIPVGSGNDFAHLMNIPLSIPEAFKRLLNPEFRSIDLIKVDGDISCYCLNTAGIGLDGRANHYTSRLKPLLGQTAYLAGALTAIFDRKAVEISISVDNEPKVGNLMMVTVCNGRREGGSFWVAPDAMPDDGLLDVLKIRSTSTLRLIRALLYFRKDGFIRGVEASRMRGKRVTATCKSPVNFHVDGEYADKRVEFLTFQVVQSALSVIV